MAAASRFFPLANEGIFCKNINGSRAERDAN